MPESGAMQDKVIRQVWVPEQLSGPGFVLANVKMRAGALPQILPDDTPSPTELNQEQIVDAEAKMALLPPLVATHVHLPDPGYEWRDVHTTLSASARAGGFGAIVCLPDSHPAVDNADLLTALRYRTQGLPTQFYFTGSLTAGMAGKLMAPLAELAEAGAIAFSDAPESLQNNGLVLRLLQYAQLINGTLWLPPLDTALAAKGVANESPAITRLGLKGIPPLAEEIAIARVLRILEYAGGKVHFSPVTTQAAVELIREAKRQGLQVSCSTAPHYLFFEDSALQDFDPNLKVLPPLRSNADRKALLQGLQDGSIDWVAAHHQPLATEEKLMEFERAGFGMLALETALPATWACLAEDLPIAQKLSYLLRWFRNAIVERYPLPAFAPTPTAEQWHVVDFTREALITEQNLTSRSGNSPFVGKLLPCQVQPALG